MSIFGNKEGAPPTFRNVYRVDSASAEHEWACEGCNQRYLLMDHPGSSTPIASPVTRIELAPWMAAGKTLAEHEADLANANRRGCWTGIGHAPTTCFLLYCGACTPKAQAMKRRLTEELRSTPGNQNFKAGYHAPAIQRHLEDAARMWGIADDLSDVEWRCISCYRRVHIGDTPRSPERPALQWKLSAVSDPYGRLTSGPVTASVCTKCIDATDRTARANFNQQGVKT